MNVYQKINKIMLEVRSVLKDTKVEFKSTKYNAVSHDGVTGLLHMPIAEAGLIVIPSMTEHELEIGKDSYDKNVYISKVWVQLEVVNIEKPEERIFTQGFAIGLDNQDKGPGKAYSMAIKYCYLKLFMLESMDEEEMRQVELKTKLELINDLRKKFKDKTAADGTDWKSAFMSDFDLTDERDIPKKSTQEIVKMLEWEGF